MFGVSVFFTPANSTPIAHAQAIPVDELNCNNGLDDDNDGDIDCWDFDCLNDPICINDEFDCDDGIDDDGDGDIDCWDFDCLNDPVCQPPGGSSSSISSTQG